MDREPTQAGERGAAGRSEWIPAGLILLGVAVIQGAGISKPFFYHVGNIEPRKNLLGLLKAFISLRGRIKGQAQLVISGQTNLVCNWSKQVQINTSLP